MTRELETGSEIFSSLDQLSAEIAHEINNPLGIIAQEIEWIQHLLKSDTLQECRATEDLKDSIREIEAQVQRCKVIVQRLLGLAHQIEPVLQAVNINELAEKLIALVSIEAREKNISVENRLQPDLPIVYTDPPLVRQVILNLLVNAVQAIERNGTIMVTTSITPDGFAELAVEDNGCGIPQQNLDKIFTPFFTTKPEGKGTGLGLVICRKIIERLGGHISVQSEVGKCTIFTVRLPLTGQAGKEDFEDAQQTKSADSRR
ncbi:MAG: ATP-binding protein [Thermodesulfobacteriota bacterium]